MAQIPAPEIPRLLRVLLNNLYEIESKLALHSDAGNIGRNVERMKEALAEEGVFYEDPLGQPFKETRTDLEATISGQSTEDLFVTEVIKPVIRIGRAQISRVVQKGIVVVQSKQNGSEG